MSNISFIFLPRIYLSRKNVITVNLTFSFSFLLFFYASVICLGISYVEPLQTTRHKKVVHATCMAKGKITRKILFYQN